MRSVRKLASLLFTLGSLGLIGSLSSPAVAITTAANGYTESEIRFNWTFDWDGTVFGDTDGDLVGPSETGADQNAVFWNPLVGIGLQAGLRRLEFFGQHLTRHPEHPEDAPTGNEFRFAFFGAGTNEPVFRLEPTGGNFVEIFDKDEPHPHTGPDHFDLYSLTYRRAAIGGPVTFNFIGVHSAVPEPSSFALFGAGIFALLGYAWQRRRRNRDVTRFV